MFAPLVRPRGWWWIRPASVLLQRFRETMPRDFAENSNDQGFLDFVRGDPLQSKVLSIRWIGALRRWLKNLPATSDCTAQILLLQGDADATVDWRYNVNKVQGLVRATRVEYLHGARHHLANESPTIRARIYALIDDFFTQTAV